MIKTCPQCQTRFEPEQKKTKHCSKECFVKSLQKYKHGDQRIYYWNGDDQKKYPYLQIYDEKVKDFVFFHRLAMETKIGKKLLNTDIVHHINKNTLDNRVENLRVFSSRDEHMRAEGRNVYQCDMLYDQLNDIQRFLFEVIGGVNELYIESEEKTKAMYGLPMVRKKFKEIRLKSYDYCDFSLFQQDEGNLVNCLARSPYYLKRIKIKRLFRVVWIS